jgi:ATP-dependent exoDNAse (exonuclease V) beta subunit
VAAAEAAKAALLRIEALIPAGARRLRETDLIVRLEDGRLVEGRIDLGWSDGAQWTVVDYKTDRPKHRRHGQLQHYVLALERATGIPARGIVFEI